MQKFSASQSSRPATPPMDVDVGRFELNDAAKFGQSLVAALGVSTFGVFVIWSVVPTYYDVSSWRFILGTFGLLLALGGIAYAVLVAFLVIDRWLTYRTWLQQWQDKALATWDTNGGREVTSTFEVSQLVPTAPQHVVIAALSVHQSLLSGDGTLSIPSVSGARFLGLGGNLIGVGELSPNAARNMLTTFSQVGLIRGRVEGRSGEWVPTTSDEVVQLVSKNWNKVRS